MIFNNVKDIYKGEVHMWRIPRGASILDNILLGLLSVIAFSLPIEGITTYYLPAGVRSFTYYLMILAAGIAFLRLPYFLGQFFSNFGFPLIAIVYFYITVLFIFNPIVDSAPTVLLIQLLVLAGIFTYVADDSRIRNQLMWAYYLGWCLLVLLSVYEFQTGNVDLNVRGDVVRIENLIGYSANQHARQIGVGIILSLALITENRVSSVAKFAIAGFIGIGSIALLLGGSRSTLFITIAVSIMIMFYKTFIPTLRHQEPVHRDKVVQTLLIAIALLAIYFALTETSVGNTLLQSNFGRLQEIQEGKIGKRDVLWASALEVAWEHPLGVGSNNSLYFIGQKVGFASLIDTHNYYLRMLVEGGFAGFAIFMVGIWLIFWKGWIWAIQSGESVFLFCLLFMLLVSLSGINFHLKITWFFLAMNAVTPALQNGK